MKAGHSALTRLFGGGVYRTLIAALSALCLMLLVYPAARSLANININYNEGWNAYFQLRAAEGLKLYSGYSPFAFNNYPPLSFYLIGALSWFGGDVAVIGRLVSIVSLLVSSAAVFTAVKRATGNWLDALAAWAIVVLTFTTTYIEYTGMNDPHLLGLAFAISAFALHLRSERSTGLTVLIAALIAGSVLIKHSLIAVPLVVTADVLINGSNRQRAAYLVTGAALAGLGGAFLYFTEGAAAFQQMLASRGWSAMRAADLTAEFLIRHHGLFLIGIAGCLLAKGRTERLVLGYIGVSLMLGLYFSGGFGTAANMFFDALFALAIGAGLAIGKARQAGAAPLILGAMVIASCFTPLVKSPLMLGLAAKQLSGGLAAESSRFGEEVAFLRSVKGTALCESHLLCLRAGKPMEVELFNALEAMNAGRLPVGALAQRLERREFAVVEFHYFEPDAAAEDPASRLMSKALLDNYRIVRSGVAGDFWVPR